MILLECTCLSSFRGPVVTHGAWDLHLHPHHIHLLLQADEATLVINLVVATVHLVVMVKVLV